MQRVVNSIMLRKLLLFCFLLVTLAPLQAQEVEQLIQKVRAKLTQVKDYEAGAVMSTAIPFIKVPDAAVTVYFNAPDQFRIRQKDGIVISPKGGMDFIAVARMAMGKYTAIDAGITRYHNGDVRVVKLLPLEENSQLIISTLYIDEKEWLVRKTITTTKDNGTFEMELDYGKYASWGLPDKVLMLFNAKEYKLPKGLAFDYETSPSKQKTSVPPAEKGRILLQYQSYTINKGAGERFFAK